MKLDRIHVEWSRRHFNMMADGGTWGVPRSGLLYVKRGDRLVLQARMLYDPAMPLTEKQFDEQQRADTLRGSRDCGGAMKILPHVPTKTTARFSVIYADPPWDFKTFSAKGTGRSAISHFDTMSLEQLQRLTVGAFAAPDCALLLWVTRWLSSRDIADLLHAWGFIEKGTIFTWVKTSKDGKRFPIGNGYSTRANPERCILATRGKPKVLAHDVPELIIAPREEYARKPAVTYERIERLYAGPYIELFSRNTRKGWSSWGNETDLFDKGPVKTRRQPSDLT